MLSWIWGKGRRGDTTDAYITTLLILAIPARVKQITKHICFLLSLTSSVAAKDPLTGVTTNANLMLVRGSTFHGLSLTPFYFACFVI